MKKLIKVWHYFLNSIIYFFWRDTIIVSAHVNVGGQITFLDEQVDKILMLESDDEILQERKEALVRNIVRDLPSPCDELLWGYYRDGFSMKDLAEKLNYASENTVKVTKHRCCEKFRNRFNECLKSLF